MNSASHPPVHQGQTLLRFRVQPLEYMRQYYSFSVAGAIIFVFIVLPVLWGSSDQRSSLALVLVITLAGVILTIVFLFWGSRVCRFVFFSENSHAIFISGAKPVVLYGPFEYAWFFDGRRHFLYFTGFAARLPGEEKTASGRQTLVIRGLPRVIDSTPAFAERIESLMLPEDPPTAVFETLMGTAKLAELARICAHYGGTKI